MSTLDVGQHLWGLATVSFDADIQQSKPKGTMICGEDDSLVVGRVLISDAKYNIRVLFKAEHESG
jgi:hypothetical protein